MCFESKERIFFVERRMSGRGNNARRASGSNAAGASNNQGGRNGRGAPPPAPARAPNIVNSARIRGNLGAARPAPRNVGRHGCVSTSKSLYLKVFDVVTSCDVFSFKHHQIDDVSCKFAPTRCTTNC